jgi:hypothetical protein
LIRLQVRLHIYREERKRTTNVGGWQIGDYIQLKGN